MTVGSKKADASITEAIASVKEAGQQDVQPGDGPNGWAAEHDALLVLFDAIGRRWALRVLWELRSGPLTFRALRERAAGMSSSVLTVRLRELSELGLVERREPFGYALSAAGEAVATELLALHRLAAGLRRAKSPG